MTDTFDIVDMPVDDSVRLVAAEWSITEWGLYFPDDTIDTYLDLYSLADVDPSALPIALAAMSGDEIVGTASLVVDDELPNAPEPGPWIAAVYVHASSRSLGVGRRLVDAATLRAGELGFAEVYLYTHDTSAWYESFGWTRVRPGDLHGHAVTVMKRSTSDRVD